MAWNSYARTDLAADDSAPTGIGDWLIERDNLLHEMPFAVEVSEQTETATSLTEQTTFYLWVPAFATTGYLYFRPEVKVDNALGTLSWRITNKTDSANGNTVTGIQDTSYVDSDASKVLCTSHTQVCQFGIELMIDNGAYTAYLKNTDRATLWFGVT